MEIKQDIIDLLESKGHTVSVETEGVINQLNEMVKAQDKDDVAHVLAWLEEKRRTTPLKVTQIPVKEIDRWNIHEETGDISHDSGRFFQIVGVKTEGAADREVFSWSQPIMKQEECGMLGIICQVKDGIRHYLLWAKYEPGSIVKHQLSPCIQATLSNLDRVHGGKKPKFAEYFEEGTTKSTVVFSVEHVEDPGRFYLKTNKCVLVEVPAHEEVDITDDFVWLTLPQVKKLLKMDKIMNSFTRAIFGNL
jgi:oxidase EvaA